MNLYILTSEDYKYLTDVTFLSEAPVDVLQKSLKKIGRQATLPLLINELVRQGYNTQTNKK